MCTGQQNKSHLQTQPGIYTPIDQWQDEEKKIFSTQKRETQHGQFEPRAQRLNRNNPMNAVLNEEIHRNLSY
jgi:hypothetical protein